MLLLIPELSRHSTSLRVQSRKPCVQRCAAASMPHRVVFPLCLCLTRYSGELLRLSVLSMHRRPGKHRRSSAMACPLQQGYADNWRARTLLRQVYPEFPDLQLPRFCGKDAADVGGYWSAEESCTFQDLPLGPGHWTSGSRWNAQVCDAEVCHARASRIQLNQARTPLSASLEPEAMEAAAGEASAPDINEHMQCFKEYKGHGGRDGDGSERGSAMVQQSASTLLTEVVHAIQAAQRQQPWWSRALGTEHRDWPCDCYCSTCAWLRNQRQLRTVSLGRNCSARCSIRRPPHPGVKFLQGLPQACQMTCMGTHQ